MAEIFAIDSNILITAKNREYAFDIAPSFWEKLLQNANRIVLLDEVKKEIYKGDSNDLLRKWLKSNESLFINMPTDIDVANAYSDIMGTVFSDAAFDNVKGKAEFSGIADSWICAYCLAKGHTLVTFEKFDKNIKRKVLIPNVCVEFNIPYIDLYTMMRKLSITL